MSVECSLRRQPSPKRVRLAASPLAAEEMVTERTTGVGSGKDSDSESLDGILDWVALCYKM